MSDALLRLIESVHGHLGVLAAVALLHPAILLRRGAALARGTRLAVVLTGLVVALAYGSGLFLYREYVARVRIRLFALSPRAGMLFETKEHLAFVVAAASLGAVACALCAPRESVSLRRAAATLFAVAAALCLVTAALGSYVASVADFR
jgi:hypothetical protein